MFEMNELCTNTNFVLNMLGMNCLKMVMLFCSFLRTRFQKFVVKHFEGDIKNPRFAIIIKNLFLKMKIVGFRIDR